MSKRIADDELEKVFLIVQGNFRRRASNDNRKSTIEPIWVTVDARIVSPLLDELRKRRRHHFKKGGNISPISKAMAEMRVGGVLMIDPVSHGAMTTYRKTARNIMDNPQAAWHTKAMPDGKIRIKRMADGTNPHADYSNPVIGVLSRMEVGDVVRIEMVGKMYSTIKVRARQKMGNAEAQWRCENLANGSIRVTRKR